MLLVNFFFFFFKRIHFVIVGKREDTERCTYLPGGPNMKPTAFHPQLNMFLLRNK